MVRISPIAETSVHPCDGLLTVLTRLNVRSTGRVADGRGTPAQGQVLATVLALGPQSVTQLAERECITQPAMTGLCLSLERAGLARRERHATDGRVTLVSLTPAGESLIQALRSRRIAAVDEALARLAAADVQVLAATEPILVELVDRMRQINRRANRSRARRASNRKVPA